MSNERSKNRVENGAWTCLYGGLMAVVLGFVFQREGEALQTLACSFQIAGGLVAAAGVGLIWLRSRMQ